MNIEIHQIKEPLLEFGSGATGFDPKVELAKSGPFGSQKGGSAARIVCGIVALPSEVEHIKNWIGRMHTHLVCNEKNIRRYREFPGITQAFQANIFINERFIRTLDPDKYNRLMAEKGASAFNALLDFYSDAISSLWR